MTANKGEFFIAQEVEHRKVEAHPRRYASMFSPSSSKSRFEIRDSGNRYEFRLTSKDDVEFSINGGAWMLLRPDGKSPWKWGVSHQTSTKGKKEPRTGFDMIVASRGRLIAKELGTDRLFHLVIDPLFRTGRLIHAKGIGWLHDGGDPIVPSNYFKLDPGFFTEDTSVFIPKELSVGYDGHPASVRFKLVNKVTKAEMSDSMCVPVVPRVWYLIDGRSPLKISDPDDLRCIGDEELKQVATTARIKAILRETLGEDYVRAFIQSAIENLVDPSPEFPLPKNVKDELDAIKKVIKAVDSAFDDLVGGIEGVPGIGDLIKAVRKEIKAANKKAKGAQKKIGEKIEAAVEKELAELALKIERALVDSLLEIPARVIRELIKIHGFGAALFPALLVLAFKVHQLRSEGALAFGPPDSTPGPNLGEAALNVIFGETNTGLRALIGAKSPDAERDRNCGERSQVLINLDKTLEVLTRDNSAALRKLIQKLIEAAAHHPIPNGPPEDVPSYVHVAYARSVTLPIPGGRRSLVDRQERRSIAFKRVMDLGMGTSHWSEQWQQNFGGEIHSLLATYPFAQQERFSLMHYRFFNGPIIDGDGWCDGTTNFYMLVELDDPEPKKSKRKGRQKRPKALPEPRFAILWHDEQTYFTQRWRLLHPIKDTAGDQFSLARALRDKPRDFRFDITRFWSPLENGCITRESRMAVARQMVALSGRDPVTGKHEVYTICFAFGICDHTWRWRPMPEAESYAALDQALAGGNDNLPAPSREVVYTNTLGIRDDGTLTVRGFKRDGGRLIEGRWVQKYLPADCRHIPDRTKLQPGVKPPTGFSHPWEFISEAGYRLMDRHYGFGVYDKQADSRCQFYEVDLLPDEKGVITPVSEVRDRVWENGGQIENPLTIDTISFDWQLPEIDGYINPEHLLMHGRDSKSVSMYESSTRFRLLERRPRGLIAVFYDKRDDDLQSVSHLPRETILLEDLTTGQRRTPRRSGAKTERRRIRVLFRANHRVSRPPVVQKVEMQRIQTNNLTTALNVKFWTSQTGEEVHQNLWRMHLAALDAAGERVSLFTVEVFDTFARVAAPNAPLPFDYVRENVLKPEFQYEASLPVTGDPLRSRIDQYCAASGRNDHATAVWFEDIVGHACCPEQTHIIS